MRILKFCFFFTITFLFFFVSSPAQNLSARVFGIVKNSDKKPMAGVSVGILGSTTGTITNDNGEFSMLVPSNQEIIIVFTSVGYENVREKLILADGEKKELNRTILKSVTELPNIIISNPRERNTNIIRINPKDVEEIPNPTGNFESLLKSMGGGVVSNCYIGYCIPGGSSR